MPEKAISMAVLKIKGKGQAAVVKEAFHAVFLSSGWILLSSRLKWPPVDIADIAHHFLSIASRVHWVKLDPTPSSCTGRRPLISCGGELAKIREIWRPRVPTTCCDKRKICRILLTREESLFADITLIDVRKSWTPFPSPNFWPRVPAT